MMQSGMNSLRMLRPLFMPSCSRALHISPATGLPRRSTRSAPSLSEKSSMGARSDMGTRGERVSELDSSSLDRLNVPILDTQKRLFDGVRYDHLPIVSLRCSKNNTKIGFTTHDGKDICYTSSSQEGFKNAKKKTMVAGQATGVAAALRALRRGVTVVRVLVKGLGPGRMAGVKGLTLGGLKVVSITDITPLPELGPRPQKMRRL